MTIAEEVASLWLGVAQKPVKGQENPYYADLLRRLMVSKKQLEETGRKYSILPDLRELTRRTLVRIPAEHVPYLEVSVFDLISNPLKKNLQPHVAEFSTTGADFELVSWFVRHAKKEPTLALDFKALQAWYDQHKPVETVAQNQTPQPSTASVQAEENKVNATPETKQDEAAEGVVSLSQTASSFASPPDTTVATTAPVSDGTAADRIFEHD